MTRKLYYEDCHLAAFSARVVSCCPVAGGWEVMLDATAFYPEGGGQACDLGTLSGVRVLDVQERGEDVVHLCDGPLLPESVVEGQLNWQRRFDLMQQHTGEHLISGIIHARYGWHNVGFHIGADVITIDFDGPVPAEDLPGIEAAANAALWQDLPVHCRYPDREELAQMTYRSKKALQWPVRIVEIPGYDSCACCGVHTARTGEVGLVKLFTAVKFHQGVRIEMACGQRAMEMLNRAYEQNRLVSQAFSAKITETGEAARKMNDALGMEKARAAGLQRQLFRWIAGEYAGRGDVVHFQEGLEPATVRELADAVAEVCGGMAAIFSGSDGEGYHFCLLTRQGDLRPVCKAMTQALSGRGGGKPNFQQGRVQASRRDVEAFFAGV